MATYDHTIELPSRSNKKGAIERQKADKLRKTANHFERGHFFIFMHFVVKTDFSSTFFSDSREVKIP